MTDFLLLALAAPAIAGVIAWALGRRIGLNALWAALTVGAVTGLIGWFLTRDPVYGQAALERSVMIYFTLLPGFIGLVMGAIIGAWQHRAEKAPLPH